MRAIIDSLRKFGLLGNLAANLITFLTTNWSLTLSAAVAVVVAAWEWATHMAQLPETRVAVGTFLACLWTFLGLSLVARRNNTVKVQIEPSYGYSLAYEGLGIAFEEDNEEAALQLGLNLRNVGSGPLRYKFERFDVIVENRTIGRNVPLSGGFIPRAAARVYKHPAFRKQDIKDFIGTTANGFVEISVVYGNPELPPVRRLKMKIDVYMRLSTGFSIADNIVDESDEEI